MKLRFRGNSLRLRLNRTEVRSLAGGQAIEEQIHFPGESRIAYRLAPSDQPVADASFADGLIRIGAPRAELQQWADGESIGLYFSLPANGTALKVAIEKDLECLDGPEEERDVDAFPRQEKSC